MFFFHFNREGANKLELMSQAIQTAKAFKNQPILDHVFICLLTRGTSSDLLTQSLTKDQVVSNISSLFNAKKEAGNLTVEQFK